MNIAILGTRGVPNHYGGFEQFAENLSVSLVQMGHSVTVYNSHLHPYQEKVWNGVKIVHCWDLEDKIGTAGQFVYDLNCILHSRKCNYDIILQLGYTSNSLWGWLLPRKNTIITTNMDGLEWKRSKYSKPVQRFLRYAEKLAVKYSDYLIADSVGIQQYLRKKYKKDADFIPYGAHLFNNPDNSILEKYGVQPYKYNLLIARMEPENSIEMILEGVAEAGTEHAFIVIGNTNTKYGRYIREKFVSLKNIVFTEGIFDIGILNNLRFYSNLYFHGHSVGGTNPSLLEAMASQALVCANDNVFNKSILGGDAFYFNNSKQVGELLREKNKKSDTGKVEANIKKIKYVYSWPNIINQYVMHFESILQKIPAITYPQFGKKGQPALDVHRGAAAIE